MCLPQICAAPGPSRRVVPGRQGVVAVAVGPGRQVHLELLQGSAASNQVQQALHQLDQVDGARLDLDAGKQEKNSICDLFKNFL